MPLFLVAAVLSASVVAAEPRQTPAGPAAAPAFVSHKPGRADVELTIRPGTSTRAEVELTLGDPVRRVSAGPDVFEYAPTPGAAAEGVARFVVEYFADTKVVARVDVYMKTPVPADSLAGGDYGTRVIQRDRPDGGREDLYYPSLQAAVFASSAPRAPAVAIGFLSPRALAVIYARRSEEHLKAERVNEARNDADKALLVDPESIDAHMALAGVLFAQNDYAGAVPHYRLLSAWADSAAAATYDTPLRIRMHIRYGYVVSHALGDHAEALAAYQLALKRDPKNTSALNNIGHEYHLRDQLDKAEAFYRKALGVDPAHVLASRNLVGLLLHLKRSDEAFAQAEAARKARPAEPSFMVDLARCWGDYGRKGQALDWVRKAVEAGFKDRDALASDKNLALIQQDKAFLKLLDQIR